MDVQTFTQKYSVNVVAGSMEKPNSVFKKKEAIEVAQVVGQFARRSGWLRRSCCGSLSRRL